MLAAPASAGAGTRSETVEIPPAIGGNFAATAEVKCGAGRRATGGGFETTAPETTNITVFESRKRGQRFWLASAYQNSAAPASLTAFVYCSKDAPKTKQKRETITGLPLSGLATATARCGRAGKAQAGGFLTPNDPDPPHGTNGDIVDSFRGGTKSWRTRIFPASSDPARLVSYVYCAKQKAPKARSRDAHGGPGFADATVASKRCRRHTAVVAGGFEVLDASVDGFFVPTDSFRSGRRWQVSADHIGTEEDTLRSIAYCG